jgi:hypothetical protein
MVFARLCLPLPHLGFQGLQEPLIIRSYHVIPDILFPNQGFKGA